MTNTKLLRGIISDKGLKYSYVANKLGVTPYCLQQKIENVREFKSSEIQMLCAVLEIDSLQLKEKIFFAKRVEEMAT